MKAETKCPKCGSANVRKAKGAEWQGFDIFSFAAIRPKKCEGCGQIWEPAAPVWLLVVGIVVGLVMIGLAVLMWPMTGWSRKSLQCVLVAALGMFVIVNSILRLCKRGVRLIEPGKGIGK